MRNSARLLFFYRSIISSSMIISSCPWFYTVTSSTATHYLGLGIFFQRLGCNPVTVAIPFFPHFLSLYVYVFCSNCLLHCYYFIFSFYYYYWKILYQLMTIVRIDGELLDIVIHSTSYKGDDNGCFLFTYIKRQKLRKRSIA